MESYDLKRGAYKNLTLRLSPDGSLKVSAPWFLPRFVVDEFVTQRKSWIAEKRRSLSLARTKSDLDSLPVWGVAHRIRVESPGRIPRVHLNGGEVVLRVPAGWTSEQHQKVLDTWQKDLVTQELLKLVPAWSARMKLKVEKWTVKRLRSRWGSCRPDTKSLVFNSRLAALPPECLEHVVVHELVHLIEASHNARFHALVEHWLPGSARVRKLLKRGSADSDAFADPPSTTGAETAR